MPMLILLANAFHQSASILFWSVVLMAMVLALFFIAVAIKKKLDQTESRSQAPFSLDELRQMHQAGQLNDEEYARAREQIITMVAGDQAPPAQQSKPPVGTDDEQPPDNEPADSPDRT